MTKSEAIALFESGANLARALGISRAAVSKWPEELDQRTADEITGAAIRLGKRPKKIAAAVPSARG